MNSLYASLLALFVAVSIVTAAPSIEHYDLSNEADSGEITHIKNSLKNNQTVPANNSTTNPTKELVFADVLGDMLIALKRIMPCGAPSLGVPILAPYRQPKYEFAVEEKFLKLNGEIKNLVVTGINDILIISLTTNTSTNRTTYDVFYKDLQFLGDFDVHVDADLAGYRYINHAQGLLNFQAQSIRYTFSLTLGTNEVGGTNVSDVDYYVEVGDIISRNLNPNLNVATQNFLNQYIRDATLLFLQTHRERISKAVSGLITNTLNKDLYNTTITELLTGIVEVTELYNSIDCSP